MDREDADDRLTDVLVRTAFHVTAVLTRLGGENDLSLTQLRVLGILRDRSIRVTDLAAHLGLDKSTMSGLVDRAERRGLVRRARAADDGRVVEVTATPEGAALMARLQHEGAKELGPALDRLDPAGQEDLARLLETVLTPVED